MLPLFASTLALALIAAATLSTEPGLLREFGIGVVLALGCGIAARVLFRASWFRDTRYLLLFTACGLAALLLIFGDGPAGTDTKIRLWGVQPVEVIKLLLVFFLASYFAARDTELTRLESRRVLGIALPRLRDAVPVVAAVAGTLGLFVLQRDLGPALVLYLTFLAMFVAASRRVALGVLGLFVLVCGWWLAHVLGVVQTVSTRIEMWRSPWDTTRVGGGQLAESLWALASGGLWGAGVGRAELGYIPAGHTDLILAATGETFGLAGVLAVLLLCALLILAGAIVAWRAPDAYSRYLAYGLTALLGVQVVVITSGTIGLLPLTGVPLPFMSYGKSATVVQFVAIGVLASIARGDKGPRMSGSLSRWAALPVVLIVVAIVAVGGRAWQVMARDADAVLIRGALTPQADGVRRYTHNRRLLDLVGDLPRGRVLDRQGLPLATDHPTDVDQTRTALSPQLDADVLSAGRDTRRYPLGRYAPQVLGHARAVWADSRTVERAKAEALRGFDLPERTVLVDGHRVQHRDYTALIPLFRARFATDGPLVDLHARNRDVRITLDARLQVAAFRALEQQMPTINGTKRTSGAGVVLDAQTGAILASVSLPTYDPNAIDQDSLQRMFGNASKAALDRARHEVYPPGSTFKLVTAIAALRSGVSPSRPITCAHQTRVAWSHDGRAYLRRVVDDSGSDAHQSIALGPALAKSCNVYFASVATQIGAEALWAAAHDAFRLTMKDVPDVRTLADHLADHAYGQALVTTTPLEMASVVAAIVNGGRRVAPSLYAEEVPVVDGENRVASELAAALMRNWLIDAVRSGTGRRASAPGWVVGGKTGTAETQSGDGVSHSWFVGFAHREGEPESRAMAFAFIIENGGYGGVAASQVVREFLSTITQVPSGGGL